MAKEIIRFWKGSENAYKELYKRGRIKDGIRYMVICLDGSVKEYLGKNVINNGDLEQIAALDNAISITSFQEKLKKEEFSNCRLLVGDDNAFDSDGKLLDEYEPSESETSLWYVVIFDDNKKQPKQIIDFSSKTARIKAYKMKEYQVVDNVLMTYNHMIWNTK